MELLRTPVTTTHLKLGARLVPFAGWEMPVQYQGIISEHLHTRTRVSLFDISHMGELLVTGRYASRELGRLVTHDLEKAVPGKCSYGFMLTSAGTIRDDLIIYPLEEERLMLVVNASRKQEDLKHLQDNLSSEVRIKDITMSTGKLDLQGPESLSVLEKLTKQDFRDLKYFHFRNSSVAGLDLLISRTGYTGELGFEIYAPWDETEELWTMIMKDERVKPAGLGARDTLRLEAGLPLYGQDLDQDHTPAEAGYGFVLKSKLRYLGGEKAMQIRERLTGLVIQGRRTPRRGDPVFAGDVRAGRITSGSFAPSLGHCIAFAYIDQRYAKGPEFSIQRDRVVLRAEKADPPFYVGTARMSQK